MLRALNMLLWTLVWTSGALVSHAEPHEGLFDAQFYADSNGFLAQGFLLLLLMTLCDLALTWISQKRNRRQAL